MSYHSFAYPKNYFPPDAGLAYGTDLFVQFMETLDEEEKDSVETVRQDMLERLKDLYAAKHSIDFMSPILMQWNRGQLTYWDADFILSNFSTSHMGSSKSNDRMGLKLIAKNVIKLTENNWSAEVISAIIENLNFGLHNMSNISNMMMNNPVSLTRFDKIISVCNQYPMQTSEIVGISNKYKNDESFNTKITLWVLEQV